MYCKNNLLKTLYFLILFIIIFQSICFASDDLYVWSSDYNSTIQTSNPVNSNTQSETDSNIDDTKTNNFLNLESGSAILIEQESGQILYEHNIHEKLRPASVTKVMSILLIMEAIDSGKISLDDKVPCSEKARAMGGSQIWLNETESLTVNEMLKAICIVSANDAVVAMAEFISGSEEAFVEKMNLRAKELGMNDTCFKNCHGIDEDGHLTSSYDIALMSRELLKNHPSITNYTTIWMDTLRDGKSELVNTNKLIRNYKGATGLKTGSTSLALYNLSASATRDSLSLIAVIMKAPSTKLRFSEAQKLLDYGFNNYSYKEFAKKGDFVKTAYVSRGIEKNVNAVFETNSGILLKKGQEKDIVQSINIGENLSAPIYKGQKIGEVCYSLNGNLVATCNIVSDGDVQKDNFGNILLNIYKKWFCLLR